jgi:hypothetical protein
MPRASKKQIASSSPGVGVPQDERYVDLQIDWVRYKSGTPIARFGGLWDRVHKRFGGHAPKSRVIEVHAQQISAIQIFDKWMDGHLRGNEPISDRVREIIQGDIELDADTGDLLGLSELFLSGGRRSGKTTIMEGILASYSVAVPGSIVWTVVPSEAFHVEPKEVLEAFMPMGWYEYNGWPQFTFYLINGSQHVIRSGHKASLLKKGKANLVGLNEAQQLSEASYRNARGATVDDGGFTISALNPPTVGDIGTWTADAVEQIEKGDRPGAEHIFVDPMDNPHIDIRKLLAMRSGMTAHDWETQIRGRFLSLPDVVLYAWSRAVNERPTPDFGRITNEFLTAHEGDRAKWDKLVVVDVQGYPWIAAGVFDIYRDPRDPHNPKAGLLWMVDEVALAQADELDVCEELKRRGYNGDRTLVIMDASCAWQQMQRDHLSQRPDFKGKGSMDMFRKGGFPHVVPPDRAMRSNPDVLERIRCTNATIKPMDEIAGMFIDDRKCPNGVESARKWRMKKGRPHRRENAAHFGDVLGYVCWRFFPRRGNANKLLSEGIDREHGELAAAGQVGRGAATGPRPA